MKKRFSEITLLIIVLLLTIGITYARFQLTENATGSINVYSYDFCKDTGFTKLSDCMLVMENYSRNIDQAKKFIENKGEPNSSQNAPTILFREVTENVTNETTGVISTQAHFSMSSSYYFDSSTGMFNLINPVQDTPNDNYINYYTCGSTQTNWASCSKMYQIKAYRIDEGSTTTIFRITSAVLYNYNTVNSFDSEVGLYGSADNDGMSYYYRGDVKNNYVSFAGYIWRIIRRNGDSSVRLIYSGTSTSAIGTDTTIGITSYNDEFYDPTYVGYKYSKNFGYYDDQKTVEWKNFTQYLNYYFSDSYTFDEETKKFSLSGQMTKAIWKSDYENIIQNYPYTCFSSSASASCDLLIRVIGYNSASNIKANILSYSSLSYNGTLQNDIDSKLKTAIDTWYENNILNRTDSSGREYSDYLGDSTFCNDRSVSTGTGYKLTTNTIYNAQKRILTDKKGAFICKEEADRFSVSNGNLKYPIATITSDEVNLAGAYYSHINTRYYLYTGDRYWTMSPSQYGAYSGTSYMWYVNSTGALNAIDTTVSYSVRPVINLKSDVEIIRGTGTADDPYIITE